MKKKKVHDKTPQKVSKTRQPTQWLATYWGTRNIKKKYKETNKVYKVYKLGISMREVLVKKGVQPWVVDTCQGEKTLFGKSSWEEFEPAQSGICFEQSIRTRQSWPRFPFPSSGVCPTSGELGGRNTELQSYSSGFCLGLGPKYCGQEGIPRECGQWSHHVVHREYIKDRYALYVGVGWLK